MKKIKLNKKLLLAKEVISGLNAMQQQHVAGGATGDCATNDNGCIIQTCFCSRTVVKTQCISNDTALCVTVHDDLCATDR